MVTALLKFEICPSGTAAAEAQLTKDAIHCDVGRGQHATPLNAKSACSDHKAPGTTDAVEVLKKEEVEEAAAAALDDAARAGGCSWGVPWGRGARVEVRQVWFVGGVVPMAAGGMGPRAFAACLLYTSPSPRD